MKRMFCALAAALLLPFALRGQTVTLYSSDRGPQVFSTRSPDETVLDTARIEVGYRMTWQQRSEHKPLTDLLLLQVGRTCSKCYSYKSFQVDSLICTTPVEDVLANPTAYATGVQWVVITDHPAGHVTHTDKIATDFFLVDEPMPRIDWSIGTEERTILGYLCRRATGSFRGRRYEVWFTEDIPVQRGPWMLQGVPGLILSAKDDAGVIAFEADGIRNVSRPITFTERPYLKTTSRKLEATRSRFMTDPLSYLHTTSNVRIQVVGPDGRPVDTPTEKRSYNALELE